jgi:Tol biopolymer transport system component
MNLSIGRRAHRAAAALVLLIATAPAAVSQQRPMTIVDLINVPRISDPQLSPRGSQLVYVRNDANWDRNTTVSHLWRVNTDGSGSVQLTSGKDGENSPRWSADGLRIAFLAKRGDDEETQIYLLNNNGGEGLALTKHPTSVSNISWSPDGRWIYFMAEDEKTKEEKAREKIKDNVFAFGEDFEHRHLWRVLVETGKAERITEGDFTVRGYQLSRDGRMIAHHRAPSPLLDDGQASEVWLMDGAGGEARQLTRNTIGEGGAELSPDNSRLLFVANANQELEFYY